MIIFDSKNLVDYYGDFIRYFKGYYSIRMKRIDSSIDFDVLKSVYDELVHSALMRLDYSTLLELSFWNVIDYRKTNTNSMRLN